MTTNTIVAVVSDGPVEPGTSFAAATHAAQSRKPHRMITAVRIGFSLASAMLPSEPQEKGEFNEGIDVVTGTGGYDVRFGLLRTAASAARGSTARPRHAEEPGGDQHHSYPRFHGSRESHPGVVVERRLCGRRRGFHRAVRSPDEGQRRGSLPRQTPGRSRLVPGSPRRGGSESRGLV